ncbi:polyadenylate-binding protein-interacting protein 3 isoform X2 [Raphanus sativus]|uniref:Polyadenylate-binding protein-interacting protein 3 isoform X2 n=1 Tax=Raphanus sativus TaxID=3726 RepID=A0A6J0NWX4_RAPSA|nr:polyadenylate-binding protein-interacting protein 3 isoform X2 [Raphanus sativus]
MHRRVDKEAGMKNTENGGKAGTVDTPSRDPFLYLTTCQIGHGVEVHLKNGSVYSGIFHAADVENNFGIILKMACLIREGSLRGKKPRAPLVSKPPLKIFIIPADEVVQVIAKDLPVNNNNVSNSAQCEKPSELLTDSSISQSYHVDSERELKRWVPDEDVPDCPDLENVFDDPWKKGWNQFEVNETLFGVTSTFDEELYTTKLERGPLTRELLEQALRIAREIEGENTRDLHVAEERGLQLSGKFDIDEETKYSSVCPVNGFDDSGYEEEKEILLDCRNNMTFGDSNPNRNESQLAEQRNGKSLESSHYKKPSEESAGGLDEAATSDPACLQLRASDKRSSTDGKLARRVTDRGKFERSGSSISRNPDNSAASSSSSRPKLSPSSSIGSCSSEKSTLNSNAKEFKLNPNAKSFKPSPTATRPQSPVPDGSFFYPPVPQMPGIHIGYGMGAAFPGQQPMVYHNTRQPGPNQTFYPPNGPQYHPQQMMVVQQRPVLFMPPSPYQPEMPYKGRDSY